MKFIIEQSAYSGVLKIAGKVAHDMELVTGTLPEIRVVETIDREEVRSSAARELTIIVATMEHSRWLDAQKNIPTDVLKGKRECYGWFFPDDGLRERLLVIVGSDKRGTIYGLFHLSEIFGVSPFVNWCHVVPVHRDEIRLSTDMACIAKEPSVEYRGFFINDEWPAFGTWSEYHFGGSNAKAYEPIFELLLRLKGNYLWPAMWSARFEDDGPGLLNAELADEYGVIMGMSHHEPCLRQGEEYKYLRGKDSIYGDAWNFKTNREGIIRFWEDGLKRSGKFENVITVGMRGEADTAIMGKGATLADNIELLRDVLRTQRKLIRENVNEDLSKVPRMIALYKEVEAFFYGDETTQGLIGSKELCDVILMLCDDNYGNLRTLPTEEMRKHLGGYGMYYHFDYVGAPRNSKWINITQIQRTWEQMALTYDYGVRELWVVNVGDLKPMEYPITFFLDMAWNTARFNENNLFQHTVDFCRQQFGGYYAEEAARLIDTYTKYNRRVTPEMLDDRTYSLENYNEWQSVKDEYAALCLDALKLYYLMPAEYRDAFDQLVLFPIQACSNLYDMYYAVAMNRKLAEANDVQANKWADKARACFERDSVLTYHYNHIMSGGKWNHIMDQTHIGYKSWNDPKHNIMPKVTFVPEPRIAPAPPVFVEKDGYVSIEAEHYTRSANSTSASWVTIPNLGRTLSAVTTLPTTAVPGADMYVEYDFETEKSGDATVIVRFSSTLNFNDYKGLRYAVSLDGGEEQIVNINSDYKGELGKLQADHIITTQTKHLLDKKGRHTLRIRPLDPALVMQKIMIDMGGLKPSFLGAPESLIKE